MTTLRGISLSVLGLWLLGCGGTADGDDDSAMAGTAGAMMVTTPSHLKMLTSDPLGIQMIIGALVLQVIGTLIIRKLVDIPY